MSNYNTKKLCKQIETARKQMTELSREKSFCDYEMIKISQKLDTLLNEYERLKKAKRD